MKPIWTILITVVATAAVVGGGTYYLINKSADKDKSDLQAQIDDLNAKVTSATKAPSKTVTSGTTVNSGATVSTGTTVTSGAATTGTAVANPTASWKTLADSHFKVSFKYPSTWAVGAGGNTYVTAAQNEMGGVAETYIDLTAVSGKSRSVYVTKLADYVNNAANQSNAAKIKSVYTSQAAPTSISTVSGSQTVGLFLPPVGASAYSPSKPTYLATADNKFRGFYYFANVGQDANANIDCIIMMTDGTNLITFDFANVSDKAASYPMAANGTGNASFNAYVSALTASATGETTVTEFNSIYSLIAKSLATSS